MTAMALLHFARRRVDAVVLEVGMGGRLDSTNVCEPLVSVITSISFDHTQQLGNTLAAIAGEKAGIVKRGVPVVSGVLTPEPRDVVASNAREQGSRLIQLSEGFSYAYRPARHLERGPSMSTMDFSYDCEGMAWDLTDLELSLAGEHQAANAAVALATLGELVRQRWTIPAGAMRQGLSQVRWPARIEVIARDPAVVLDAAHNVASIEALVRVLDESFSCSRRVLVFATTRDKDVEGMLRVLLPKFDEIVFTRYRNNPRGVPPEELDAAADGLAAGARHVASEPELAWRLARELARPQDLVCITGSFFIAAEMRAVLRESERAAD
jgi:dihydrofolate synthase/folylpolyglutamate synthase